MRLFDVLGLHDPRITPAASKVHFATFDGAEDPLRVYLEGKFDEWQSWQRQRNFSKDFVVSLIQLPERDHWLYVGTYAVKSVESREGRQPFFYTLEALPSCSPLESRLVVNFPKRVRQSYLHGTSVAEKMLVYELRAERLHLEEFPGFKKINLRWPDLEIIVRQGTTSWRTALSSVAGVYLISDPQDGKLYVGSATGEGGIWARWCQYVDGHGRNVELLKVVGQHGRDRARAYRFSILEIADVHASRDEVLAREGHWKTVLLSKTHGYNAN